MAEPVVEEIEVETAPSEDHPIQDPAIISKYHAHLYYDPVTEKARAALLRKRVAEHFKEITFGRWHDDIVGPHTQCMYKMNVPVHVMPAFLPWLMMNRLGLTVLFHPKTNNDYRDNVLYASWLGEKRTLNEDRLKGER
jgi:DOPA 4,5-dioxygenase